MRNNKLVSGLIAGFVLVGSLSGVTAPSVSAKTVQNVYKSAGTLYIDPYQDAKTKAWKSTTKDRMGLFEMTSFTVEYVGAADNFKVTPTASGIKKVSVTYSECEETPDSSYDTAALRKDIENLNSAAKAVYRKACEDAEKVYDTAYESAWDAYSAAIGAGTDYTTAQTAREAAIKTARDARSATVKAAEDVYLAALTANNKKDDYHRATVTLYATAAKAYTLKVSMTADGVASQSKSVKVYANVNNVIKTATYAGQTLQSYTESVKSKTTTLTSKSAWTSYVTKASGKLKVTANPNYTITGGVIATIGANGKITYKALKKAKIKKGVNITLSKGYNSNDSVDVAAGTYTNNTIAKRTCVYLSYKDSVTGETCTYSIDKKSKGRTVVKKVVTEQNGDKTTSYIDWGSDTLSLYQY